MASEAAAAMFRKFAGTKVTARKSKADAKEAANEPESVTIEGRKHDGYTALHYQFPIETRVSWGGINIGSGWTWKNGVFLGSELGGGYSTDGDAWSMMIGVGFNFGSVYDLGNDLQFVYGLSAGLWLLVNDASTSEYTAIKQNCDFLGPFVKLRWRFVEITYRGLLGIYGEHFEYTGISNVVKPYIDDSFGGWNNQLMIGLYFATSKRER